ncbi:MAG: Hsp20/alpha crystallin family protein [Candidatus Rokubacteria bacterium]|nr:Hsp20/alpha crystallin family protein [Candidatus Rokubacteria bacterium]
MRALAPWTGMDVFKREMDRLFDRFFEPRWDEFELVGEWAPKVDVVETKDAVVVKAELPGMEQKDISVELEDHVLTIKGEKHQEKEEKGEKLHRMERSWGAFSRSFRLPAAVEGGKVNATFKNGILVVTLPKAPTAKGTTIPVKAE